MKQKENLKKQLGYLSIDDIEKVTFLIEELKSFLNKKDINEDGLRRLDNLSRELENFRSHYTWKAFKLLKQGHMLD